MIRMILTLFGMSFYLMATGQFFTAKGQPCVWSSKRSRLDTIMYGPEESMPFDRCFYLTYKTLGNPKLDYFTLTPIDKFGNKKVRKRDYKTFLRSEYADQEPDATAPTWAEFKDPANQMFRLFDEIKTFPSGNGTETFLRVSPLDPNRSYRIILLTQDQAALSSLASIENSILRGTSTGLASVLDYNQAMTDFATMTARRLPGGSNFRPLGYKEFIHSIYPCARKILFEFATAAAIEKRRQKNKDSSYTYSRTHEFYLVPKGQALTDTQAKNLPMDRHATIVTEHGISGIAVELLLIQMKVEGTKDVTGKVVNFKQLDSIDVFMRVQDNVAASGGFRTSALVYFGPLGSAAWQKSSNDNRIAGVTFVPDAKLPSGTCADVAMESFMKVRSLTQQIEAVINASLPGYDTSCFSTVMTQVRQCDCEKDVLKSLVSKDEIVFTTAFFGASTPIQYAALQKGFIAFKSPFQSLTESDWAGRSANLKANHAQLRDLQAFVMRMKAQQASGRTSCLDALSILLDTLNRRFDILQSLYEKMAQQIKARQESLARDFSIYSADPLATNATSVLDFVSANKFRIVPDFGLVGVFSGRGVRFQDLMPYLGFHINFRSIDKSIEMKDVKFKSWRHYFSFLGGITLRSMKIEGKREDFFANNNLITGLGFRLNNFFRITGGAIWFKTVDKNPLSSNKPIGFSPFIGLSLDLELQSLFGGLQNIFK